MALSFLYLAVVRVLDLLRLRGRDITDLAIEVIVLRHEVAALRRQMEGRSSIRIVRRDRLGGLIHEYAKAV